MKRTFLFISAILAMVLCTQAQYISRVLEYQPAPGQLINAQPWGFPSSVERIVGNINGTLCLGAFGGYVVFEFDQAVENHPDNPFGVDFTIFGNPQPNWAEPAVVYVMKDENENGQADDTWFELAGSDYWFSSTVYNYEVSYTNPGGNEAADIPWTDNQGNSGFIFANSVHTQSYYPLADSFPAINPESYTLSGTYIYQLMDSTNPGFVQSRQRAFGYADNNLRGSEPYTIPDNPYTPEKENSGGDAFDISWAVDENGNYVDLDKIHFVKVQNAVQANAGWLGEISTEITGAVVVEANSSISGNLDLVVIKDLPLSIKQYTFQLEVFAFFEGRLIPDARILWQTNLPEASIDENNLLTLTQSGNLEITATLGSNPEISATANTVVDLSSASLNENRAERSVRISPNPAHNYFSISQLNTANIEVLDLNGKVLIRKTKYQSPGQIDISTLNPGVYLVRILHNYTFETLKLIKQ